jgi:hypothetical protein
MRNRIVLVAVVAIGAGIQMSGQREQGSGRYVAVDATIEPLSQAVPGGNAVLRVRFDQRRTPPPRVVYQTEGGTVVLADDGAGFDAKAGDGLYTALGNMNLVAFRDRLLRLSRSRTALPTRAYRERSKQTLDARIDPAQWQPGRQFKFEPWGEPANIDASRSLLVRATSVVEDATRTRGSCGQTSMGVWSFGYLMEQMANTPVTGVTGAQLTRQWLDKWTSDQVVNGWNVFERDMQAQILDDWIAASGGAGLPLDLSRAPFKLLAIVNRLDLRQQAAYGGASGGELRFVFRFMPPDCEPDGRTFEVIFEFGLPFSGCVSQKAWAQQWKNLDTMPLGSPAYNAALEAITQQVVVSNAAGAKPNGSALNQLRVNENRLDGVADGLDWQFRQFSLDHFTHHLKQTTLSQTPQISVDTPTQLTPYVTNNDVAILADEHFVPLNYPAEVKFRAGSLMYASVFSHWYMGPTVDNNTRHHFSLNTCNGCHTGETQTDFRHVGLALFGEQAPLSGFLTGIWADDPTGPGSHFFDDLERRAVDMDALLQTSCFLVPLDLPLVASH